MALSFVTEIAAVIPAEVASNPSVKEIRLRGLYDEAYRMNTDHHVAHQIVYNVVCDMLSKCCALEHIILDGLCLPTTSFETSSQFARIMTTSWTQLQTVDMVFTTFSVCYGVWRKTAKSHTLFPEKLSL